MCFEFGFPCVSDVPNTKFAGLTGFMFKQKQRANTPNTHKHLCGHTLHARKVKSIEDYLLPFLAQRHSKVFGLLSALETYTFSLSPGKRVSHDPRLQTNAYTQTHMSLPP